MSTLNDVLSEDDGDTAVDQIEETPVETTEAVEAETPETEEVVQPSEPAEAEEPKQEEPRTVPLQALQEERAKRQELEARMAALEGSQKQPEPAPVPDMFDNPEGYQAWQNQQIRNVQLDAFEESARDAHGDDVVDAAFQAFKGISGSPEAAAILAVKNPWRAMVKWHKEREVAANFDPEAERAKIRAEERAKLEAERPAAPPPPPSLAKATNLGDRTSREIDESALSLDDILGTPAA